MALPFSDICGSVPSKKAIYIYPMISCWRWLEDFFGDPQNALLGSPCWVRTSRIFRCLSSSRSLVVTWVSSRPNVHIQACLASWSVFSVEKNYDRKTERGWKVSKGRVLKVKNLMTFTSEHAISSEPFSSSDFPFCTADGRTWPDVKHFLGEALDEMTSMMPTVSSPPPKKTQEVYRQ